MNSLTRPSQINAWGSYHIFLEFHRLLFTAEILLKVCVALSPCLEAAG